MLQNEKILMTGPTSGVGFPIARVLAKDNGVYGLERFGNPASRARLEAAGVHCSQADLAAGSFLPVPDDFTYVLNFAVLKTGNFDIDLRASAEGPARLMAHCRKAKAWLHCSSGAVYRDGGRTPLKETDALADSHHDIEPTYSIGKIDAEVMARFGARQWNIPTIIPRFSVPYGDNGGWPAYHVPMILSGAAIPLHPDKPNLFNPIHECDYISMIPKLFAAAAVPAVTVNLGGDPLSIEDW